MRIFIGYDHRQPIAYNVCQHSIQRHASDRVQIEPLMLKTLPLKRRGLTDFTFSRYLVPQLCGYQGPALFLDADIIVVDDVFKIHEVVGTFEDNFRKNEEDIPSVWMVKNPKVRFEWPSVMYFNTWLCKELTTEYIEEKQPQQFHWAKKIGELPKEWNYCVGYDDPNPDAKVIHYTQGIPCWKETKDCVDSEKWVKEYQIANSTVSWADLMGSSVHAKPVLERLGKAA